MVNLSSAGRWNKENRDVVRWAPVSRFWWAVVVLLVSATLHVSAAKGKPIDLIRKTSFCLLAPIYINKFLSTCDKFLDCSSVSSNWWIVGPVNRLLFVIQREIFLFVISFLFY